MSSTQSHPLAPARTPEELEKLLEDCLVMGDAESLRALLDGSVAFRDSGKVIARGVEAVARVAMGHWSGARAYVASSGGVEQAGNVALIWTRNGYSVAQRGTDGGWRYVMIAIGCDADQGEDSDMTESATDNRDSRPFLRRTDEGEAWWWFNSLAVVKASAADTSGQMSIIEITEPAGEVAPLHVHHHEDEAFWIIDGTVTFNVGDETIVARTGDLVYGPRGIPHAYTVGADGCRMLFILTPGGFEEMVSAMSRPAVHQTLPEPTDEEPDWDSVAKIAEARGNEILG